MKNYSLVASIFLSFLSYGQQSIYFSEALPPTETSLDQVQTKYHGEYENEKTKMRYIVADSGIYTSSINISSISKETIRESGQYDVRNGYVFGVSSDSLPCIYDEGRYYFGVRSTDVLIGPNSLNQLKYYADGEYILNMEEGQNFTPIHLKFSNKGLTLSYFDYEPETELFDFIKQQHFIEMNYFDLVLLKPDDSEFKKVMKLYPFADEAHLKKVQ